MNEGMKAKETGLNNKRVKAKETGLNGQRYIDHGDRTKGTKE